MPTDFAFRFATYLTLLLSCICAGYAEWEYLKEVSFFTGIVAVLMAVAFVFDQRGRTVSLQNANILGGGILLLTVLWFELHRRNPDSPMNSLPWPASALPYLVALLMVLVPAKLIRPKHVGDWWALQGLGLSMVAVGGAMTDDGQYMVLLVLYSVAGVWSLTLFYIRRVSGHVPPPPPFEPVSGLRAIFSPQTYLPRWFFVARSRPTVAEPFAGIGRPTPTERLGRSHFFRAARWVGAAALMALPLFFLTPRTDGLRWELFNSRIETGISRATVDLSRTGELQPNPKPAFTVSVVNADGSPGQMPEDRRFRVSGHSSYFYPKGIWNRTSLGHLYPVPPEGRSLWPPTDRVPPQDYGNDTVLLEFVLEPDLFGTPVADPMYHRPGQPAPLFFHHEGLYQYATAHNNGTFRIPTFDPTDRGKIRHYWQYHRLGDHSPGARWRLRDDDLGATKARLPLYDLASKRIATEAKRWLERFYRDGTLPADIRDRADPATLLPAAEDHLAVAQAFERHLAESGEYEYTLSLRRFDRMLDPIEDFLFHTKAGHCERFASGLTLLLRGVGIPAQFVIGYRGCIPLDDGKYLVRQDHAHAWVEVLLSERGPEAGVRDWYWHTLDPTAGTRDRSSSDGPSSGGRFISAFITGLTPERQQQLVDDLRGFGEENWSLGLATATFALGLAAVTVLVRRRLQVRPAPPVAGAIDPAPWFSRLVELLGRAGIAWGPGRTPAEFARAAADSLAANPAWLPVAAIPERIAAALERHRYAGAPLSADDLRGIEGDLERLAAALPAPGTAR
jgi:transglutaminase-like putative cysteine protease